MRISDWSSDVCSSDLFGGRYIIHGGPKAVLEGDWRGDIIVVAFPDRAAAAAWYDSPAYQAIKPLRTAHSEGDVVLVDGVGADHRATAVLQSLDAGMWAQCIFNDETPTPSPNKK